jgi:transposase
VVHPHAAGIDIGNEAHYVAIPPGRDNQPVRRFGCTTAEVKEMADWLKQCGIRTVALQSTGVYWIAVYDILEEAGLEVYLVNARETKNLPGRKSDVQESQWLMKQGDEVHRLAPPSDYRSAARKLLLAQEESRTRSGRSHMAGV